MAILCQITTMEAEIIQKMCGRAIGIVDTAAPRLKLYRFDRGMPRQPYLYSPSIIFFCQGKKTGHLKGRTLTFDSNNYLVVAGSFPLECEYQADKENPLLGAIVEIDPVLLRMVNQEIQGNVADAFSENLEDLHNINATRQTSSIKDVLYRMLAHLESKERTKLFIDDTIKELYYHALKGEQSRSLQAMLKGGKFARILTALEYIRANFEKPISVENLAEMCHMSPTSFHRSFKEQTGDTPLQLIKKTRLSYAKSMLERKDGPIRHIAHSVGYESPSHFSRDFSRLYDHKPGELLRSQPD
jgi:AraC-like DNA-binding protein